MEYRYLGRSGLKVSPLCLGAMMFGGQASPEDSLRIIEGAREVGVNFIDTADAYNAGQSEIVVGNAVKSDRDKWVIATKFAAPIGAGPNELGTSRKWAIQSVEGSLKRLGTDYIDIIYLHRAIYDQPLLETVRAIADLIHQGKARYFGVSNFRGWRIAEIARTADIVGIDRPIVSQPLYNIVNRVAEIEQLPAADYCGLGVASYSPLARGVLTGKYEPGAPPPADTRAGRNDKRIHEVEFRPELLAIAQTLRRHAETQGISAGQFALAWVLNNGLITSAIVGPRTADHWDSYAQALDYRFTSADEELVNELVPAGHASTHGFTDPGHPLEGRVPR